MRSIWAAGLTPFAADGSINKAWFHVYINHWIEGTGIAGFFIAGKQGEFFAMSVAKRKRRFDIAVPACAGRAQDIMSCSGQNADVVLNLAAHAQACAADYIVANAPILHFFKAQGETLQRSCEIIASAVDVGIALWSHPQ